MKLYADFGPMTNPTPESKRWASLGKASEMLEVNEATLRRWADKGLIRSYRTPGGHRRFATEDIQALVEGTPSVGEGHQSESIAEMALRRIRRRLRSRAITSQAWYDEIHDEDRVRMRLFGYRLLTLASDFLAGKGRKQPLLTEAKLIGEEYGTETARLRIPLESTTQAFTFFRNALMEGLQETSPQNISPHSVYKTWQQVNTITDEVLQGIIRSYDRIHVSKTGSSRS